jgi:hypothetical protein
MRPKAIRPKAREARAEVPFEDELSSLLAELAVDRRNAELLLGDAAALVSGVPARFA